MQTTTEENVIKFPLPREERDGFVETQSAELVISTLSYAKANGDFALIHGSPGTGKTSALRYFAGQYDHVWVATMTPSLSTVVPCLEEIAEAIGIKEPSGGARRIAQAIRARVKNSRGLLIIDEAQHCKTAALEEIRSIHDATGIGIALVGNELVYARITGGGRLSTFAQLFSRVGVRLHLDAPRKRDVELIAAKHGITDESVLEVLERAGSTPGALRIVTKVSAMLRRDGRRKITAEAAKVACDSLGVEV